MLSQIDHESSQTLTGKGTQTRMDVRLARRAGLRHMAHSLHIEPRIPLMEPLVLKASQVVSEPSIEDETTIDPPQDEDDSNLDCEDDAWLNDRAFPELEAVLQKSIQEPLSAGEAILTCWF